MYLPAHFAEERSDMLHQLVAEFPLGTLVTVNAEGLVADHVPFLLEPDTGPHGRLIGHVARNNALWHDRIAEVESLVMFQGPSAYISPNWYKTKQTTHEVVPTYNYAVVHVYGPVVVHEDAKWLRGVVGKLTKQMESAQAAPWKMADAPAAYITEQLGNIVGIEIPINRIIGKWKTSQNRPVEDRLGTITGLRESDDQASHAMADMVARMFTT